jgi:hypothetical protein
MGDYAVTAANVIASANARRFVMDPAFVVRGDVVVPNVPIAGEEIEAGEWVYQAANDLFYRADANAADPAYKVIGCAENKARANQPLSIVVYDPEFQPGCTAAIGDIPIVSSNPGKICPSSDMAAGWFVSPLGVFWSTTKMALNITRSDVARA